MDDPDDFREIEGLIRPEHGLLVDELTLEAFTPNQIKKLFDLEKFRRVRCRHLNASIPAGCRRIFCTNSAQEDFYPKMANQHDRTGVLRRQLFQTVSSDTRLAFLRKTASTKDKPELARSKWRQFLDKVCEKAAVMHCVDSLVAAATEMGVGLETEVVQFARDLAKAAGLKRLETLRFFGGSGFCCSFALGSGTFAFTRTRWRLFCTGRSYSSSLASGAFASTRRR